MDQVKIGKFIAELRKSKNFTQEEVASTLGVTSQSVSKWERGINSPDISLLKKISNLFDISVEELLQGEKNSNQTNKEKNPQDKVIIDGIMFYENKIKKKYINIILILLIIVLLSFSSLLFFYYIGNYNKIKIFTINSSSDNVAIAGRLVFNPNNNIIMISDIEFNDIYTGTNKELKGKCIMIKLHSNNKTILEYGNIDFEETSEMKRMNDLIDELFVNNIIDVQNQVPITINDIEKLILTISYINKNNEIEKIDVDLILDEEFSNNSFFYN